MEEWKISVYNQTGYEESPAEFGREVKVMLFQTEAPLWIEESYSSAWKVDRIPYPGDISKIVLPKKADFYVLDKDDGDTRETGPVHVKFGQTARVIQTNKDDPPKVEVQETFPDKTIPAIKASNNPGNVQPLEMALYKDGLKMTSFKDVKPGNSVNLGITPTLYISDVNDGSNIKKGDDFKAVDRLNLSTPFPLSPDEPTLSIAVRQKPSKELIFVKL